MIKTAVLGATGIVGQVFLQLLDSHPWFEVSSVAASERNSGLRYSDAVKWKLSDPIPESVRDLIIVETAPKAIKDVDLVFSALPTETALDTEVAFARNGYIVVSNASAHRMEPFVPLLNPEVNHDHICLIDDQRRRMKWDGIIITNPNCSTIILTLPLKPVYDEFSIQKVIVSTMQATSGAGFPGVASLDILDNVIPFIRDEEEKLCKETLKILGSPGKAANFKISASCHRVPTLDGHMEAVFIELAEETDSESITRVLEDFSGEPQKLNLPSAPPKPIVVRSEEDRPQTRLDRMEGKGMSVTVGRIREDSSLGGVKFIVLGHNTIRGAAGCAILDAEYLRSKKIL